MLRITNTFFIVAAIFSSFIPAAAQDTTTEEEYSGAVVCEPGAYLEPTSDCLPAGPSVYLTTLAHYGLTLPPRPLPASKPDPGYRAIPYRYFRFERTDVPYYGSLADAQAKAPAPTFPPGFVYIAYTERDESGHYYKSSGGYWFPGNGERISELPTFQGLLLRKTPKIPFGWAVETIPIQTAPGYNSSESGQTLPVFGIVQVYTIQRADDMDWYLIAPGQWVEGRKVALVRPNPVPPEGVTNNRWIDVDLEEQTLAVYDNNRMVFATMIASGAEPFWTRPGLFQIYQKKEIETMRNNDPSDFYYLENVPFTMYFDGARALHGAYWRARFGIPQSHGCVNLSIGDAHLLFTWAQEGDWVYVHDPSGQTPTDPALYQGGAY